MVTLKLSVLGLVLLLGVAFAVLATRSAKKRDGSDQP